MEHLFKETIGVHGDIMEFGCRWGQNATLFSALEEFLNLLIGIKNYYF